MDYEPRNRTPNRILPVRGQSGRASAGRCTPPQSSPTVTAQSLLPLTYFQYLAHSSLHSFALPKWQSPCFQSVAHSFTKTPGVGGSTLKCYLRIRPEDAANPCTMNTSVKSVRNSSRINTYKIAGLKVVWNQYLQKNWGGRGLFSPRFRDRISGEESGHYQPRFIVDIGGGDDLYWPPFSPRWEFSPSGELRYFRGLQVEPAPGFLRWNPAGS